MCELNREHLISEFRLQDGISWATLRVSKKSAHSFGPILSLSQIQLQGSSLLCLWSCLSHLHPLFSLNLTSYDQLQFLPFLFPSFSPPLLNPPDSHCNLVINVFSDKKKTQPLLFPAFISLSPLCLIAVENQNAVPMTTISNESRLIALSVDTRGASRWLCLSFDLTSFRPH